MVFSLMAGPRLGRWSGAHAAEYATDGRIVVCVRLGRRVCESVFVCACICTASWWKRNGVLVVGTHAHTCVLIAHSTANVFGRSYGSKKSDDDDDEDDNENVVM